VLAKRSDIDRECCNGRRLTTTSADDADELIYTLVRRPLPTSEPTEDLKLARVQPLTHRGEENGPPGGPRFAAQNITEEIRIA
jgi:hypothetical protein